MDIQQLKEIIELFRDLGGDARQAFVWWLLLKHLPAFIFGVVWTIIGCWAVIKAVNLGIISAREALASTKLREAAGVSILWNSRELKKACRILREHYK